MFMVSVVEYVIGKVNVMVEYMLGGMHDIVVSVLIHVGGEDGLVVERLVWACVVWSMLQIYYLARGRQFV